MALGGMLRKSATLAVTLAVLGQPVAASAGDGYMLATGRTTGKAFAVGVGISSLAKVKLMPLHKMDLSAVESGGFVDNVRMLERNQAQFAILQAMFGHFARTGTGTFAGEAPNDDIRAIAMLWRDADHFVIDKDFVTTGTIADLGALRGQPVAMGADLPGPIDSNRLLLAHFDVDVDHDFNLARLSYEESAEALKSGAIKAMSTPIRPPAPHVQNVLASQPGRFEVLSFTDQQVAQADGGLGLWTPYVIPAATYPGQDRDIQTVAKSNLLVARKDVDDEVVYQVTKSIFENLDFLRNINEAMYETSVDRALVGMPMPLHPGALRYYQEIGLLGADADLEVAMADGVRTADVAAYEPNGSLRPAALQAAAPAGSAVPLPTLAAAPAAPAAGDGATFVVHFGLDEKGVSGEGMQELAKVTAYAGDLATAHIRVTGHTDRSGDPVYNDYLAGVRAKAVIAVLESTYGVKGDQIEMVTRGASEPAIDDGREYQPRNRRVEITVIPAPAEVPQQAVTREEKQDSVPAWQKRAAI